MLLQIHWPGFPFANNWSTNKFVDGLARVQIAGLAKAVGVSNFKAERVREADKILKVSSWPSLYIAAAACLSLAN